MSVRASRVLAAEPAAVWELLASTAAWPRWGPSVTAVEPADAVVAEGLTGRVRTPVGLWLPFRVTAVEPGVSWSWTVTGIPATGHRIDPDPAGCRVTFTVPGPAFPYLAVCHRALGRLAGLLATPGG